MNRESDNLSRHGFEAPAYATFRSQPDQLRGFSRIMADVVRPGGRAIILLGLMLLIATPIARVAFAAYAFAREGDWLYLGIAFVVLGLLGAAFLTGA